MPSHVQPCSLQYLSMARTSKLLEDACRKERQNFSQPRPMAKVAILQKYLLTHIHHLIDEVCMHMLSTSGTLSLRNVGRIMLATFMNGQTKKLHYKEGFQIFSSYLSSNSNFWEQHLTNVPNIVDLDLSGVRCQLDKALEILSGNCAKLEVIRFLGYWVTEKGLTHLTKIKSLRIIKNMEPNVLYFTFTGNDVPCTRLLLKSLPALEHMHCSCMGEVLAENMDNVRALALRDCWEAQSMAKHIRVLARLCPKLERLVLGHYSVFNRSFDVTPLTESTLQVLSLKLIDFSFDQKLEEFFAKRGAFLTILDLCNFDDINLNKIQVLGRTCHNLQILKLDLCLQLDRTHPVDQAKEVNIEEPLFKKLSRLEFTDNGQWDEMTLLLCLAHGKSIQSITVLGMNLSSPTKTIDNILSKLITHNPLTHLQSLVLFGHYKLSTSVIQHLFDCPVIQRLSLNLDYTLDIDSFLEGLKNAIVTNNLDLVLTYSFEESIFA